MFPVWLQNDEVGTAPLKTQFTIRNLTVSAGAVFFNETI
jgi:hypothetical protein